MKWIRLDVWPFYLVSSSLKQQFQSRLFHSNRRYNSKRRHFYYSICKVVLRTRGWSVLALGYRVATEKYQFFCIYINVCGQEWCKNQKLYSQRIWRMWAKWEHIKSKHRNGLNTFSFCCLFSRSLYFIVVCICVYLLWHAIAVTKFQNNILFVCCAKQRRFFPFQLKWP